MSINYDDLMSDVTAFKSEYFYCALSDISRGHLEPLFEYTINQCLKVNDSQATFRRMLRFFVSVGRYPTYLELALTHPWLLARIVRLADASPLLTDYLILNPQLFDDLILASQPSKLLTREEMRELLDREIQRCGESEERMQIALRRFKDAQIVQLLSIDLDGKISLEAVSDRLSLLADILLDTVIKAVAKKMGFPSPPPLAIIAYGKLGSREMSYVSDTDIVLLIDDESPYDEYRLTQFAQRINVWITNYTEAGILYETDFRLRPNGESGMLICTVDGLRNYLKNKAWTWEHQALVRARWCAGSEKPGNAFEQIRLEVLGEARDARKLACDIKDMRARMLKVHLTDTSSFNVKHSRGGIIDVEFVVQYLVLRYGVEHKGLLEHGGNIRLLKYAANLDLIDNSLAEQCADAYRSYRIWLHQHRLRGNEKVVVNKELAAPHANAVVSLWDSVFRRGPA